jgi:spermidine synthase
LWVGPLALYLLTFIIAFGRVPPWFRVVIGNMAPVMILLLVFLMISSVEPGVGLTLLLYNLTFFAAALMCHYELARDRPTPQYLTKYFLIMSLGGVLGGIFNSLLAPMLFSLSYEFPLALIIACLMVPNLNPPDSDEGESNTPHDAGDAVPLESPHGDGSRRFFRMALVLDILIPVLMGLSFWQLQKMRGYFEWYNTMLVGVADAVPWLQLSANTVYTIITYAVPVMVCFFFVDRPLRFALCVAAILGPVRYNYESSDTVHTERSFFGILKIQETTFTQYLVERTRYMLKAETLAELRKNSVPDEVLTKLEPLVHKEFRGSEFEDEVVQILTPSEREQYLPKILLAAAWYPKEPGVVYQKGTKTPYEMGAYHYRKLVHGTTLHGTQVYKHDRHVLDDFQLLTAGNVWDNIAVAGAQVSFNAREEPLTYYHRTGPVGAMFGELMRRGKEREPVAMVGLGTGSVSCYAQKGQKLTFYEIDPAVKALVADSDKYFTYVSDARSARRGGEIDFRMGDARLKLKEDTDRKYALLLVDAFSSDSIPVHLLTVEAVGLYMNRLQEGGILALHISNKYVRLEPVVAAIAEQHKLFAYVWNDEAERMHGKTASSWVVLARKREDLGDRLASPIGDLFVKYGNRQLIDIIKSTYPELASLLQKQAPKFDINDFSDPKGPKAPPKEKEPEKDQKTQVLEWLDKRTDDPRAKEFALWIRTQRSEFVTVMEILHTETGYGFRPVEKMDDVDAWTDDYADVMRVMSIEQLQRVRKFFGLPTPVER